MDATLFAIQIHMEETLRNQLIETVKRHKNQDDIFLGYTISNAAIGLSNEFKKLYRHLLDSGEIMTFSEQEFMNMLQGVTKKVLFEFIKPPIEGDDF